MDENIDFMRLKIFLEEIFDDFVDYFDGDEKQCEEIIEWLDKKANG